MAGPNIDRGKACFGAISEQPATCYNTLKNEAYNRMVKDVQKWPSILFMFYLVFILGIIFKL